MCSSDLTYVYLIYGVHYCVNAVCRPTGIGEAVLIRAIEPILGLDLMKQRRLTGSERNSKSSASAREVNLCDGPGKLCQALEISRSQDGLDLLDPSSGLWIASNPERDKLIQEREIAVTPRIGITKAAEKPFRFVLARKSQANRRSTKFPG